MRERTRGVLFAFSRLRFRRCEPWLRAGVGECFLRGWEGVARGFVAYWRLTGRFVTALWPLHDAASKSPRSLREAAAEATTRRQSAAEDAPVRPRRQSFSPPALREANGAQMPAEDGEDGRPRDAPERYFPEPSFFGGFSWTLFVFRVFL